MQRRIRLNRRDNPREQGQRVEITAGELRARLSEAYDQGKADKHAEIADAFLQLRREFEKKVDEIDDWKRKYGLIEANMEDVIRQHNKETIELQEEIERIKHSGPLSLLGNRVKRNATRKNTNQKTRPRRKRN